MKKHYAADDNIIIALQGIRYVMKGDYIDGKGEPYYIITVQYKGSELKKQYKVESERNTMYEKIREALVQQQEGE